MALVKREYVAYQKTITADNLNAIQDELIDNCVTTDQVKSLGPTAQANARAQIGAVSASDVNTTVNNNNIIRASLTVSSTTMGVAQTCTGLTANHSVVNYWMGTPSAQTGDWTITPASGSFTISGSISGTTTLTLLFAPDKT